MTGVCDRFERIVGDRDHICNICMSVLQGSYMYIRATGIMDRLSMECSLHQPLVYSDLMGSETD